MVRALGWQIRFWLFLAAALFLEVLRLMGRLHQTAAAVMVGVFAALAILSPVLWRRALRSDTPR